MAEAAAKRGGMDRMLDVIEKVGNKVPHPAVIFLVMIGVGIVASVILSALGSYVTLEDLAGLVRNGEDFVVYDAKSGEDITRSVLAQIIFEEESKDGQNLLPITFLRQLIRFYGDSMQALVPRYPEFSMENLT